MIHEIYPKVFHNEFHPERRPKESSPIIHFSGRNFLGRMDADQLSFPVFKDAEAARVPEDKLFFIFDISGEDYFMLDCGEELNIEGFEYLDIGVYRKSFPLDHAYAAITAFHLNGWYDSTRFCGRCGRPMVKDSKERAMRCLECGNLVYPRINPCVIVAVIDGDKILCTQYNRPNAGRFALVAGFSEFGESFEETVRREVMEEVGIKVKDLRFYRSEPWGQSSSLLAGFFCRPDGSTEIRVDGVELKSGHWFSREELKETYKSSHVALTSEMITVFMKGEITEGIFK